MEFDAGKKKGFVPQVFPSVFSQQLEGSMTYHGAWQTWQESWNASECYSMLDYSHM